VEIDIYALCWNEADLLSFFFRHYDPIVSRYFIFDIIPLTALSICCSIIRISK
jgi:hypothetical protein